MQSHEIANMEFHPVADIFPMMPEAELQDLAADIEANGLIESIWTYHGRIVDGRNRYRACLIAGEQPRYQEWRGGNDSDLIKFVLSLNLHRRHLNETQRGTIASKVANITREDVAKMGGHARQQTAHLRSAESQPRISQADAAEITSQA